MNRLSRRIIRTRTIYWAGIELIRNKFSVAPTIELDNLSSCTPSLRSSKITTLLINNLQHLGSIFPHCKSTTITSIPKRTTFNILSKQFYPSALFSTPMILSVMVGDHSRAFGAADFTSFNFQKEPTLFPLF